MSERPDGSARGPVSVVVVGAGPRGAGLVERLLANAPELLRGAPLDLHLVEPHGFGSGRIWRHDQAPLLRANSQAEDMTMFTDDSCTIEGPVLTGPTFEEWARLPEQERGTIPEALRGEAQALHGMTFASRRLVHEYLAWFFWRTVRDLPDGVRLHLHHDRAVDVTEDGEGQWVHLAGREDPLRADAVLLAQGHLPTRPVGESAATADAAARYGLVHLSEEFTADADLERLRPGQDVLVRGAGLAFIDLAVLVMESRGGRFVPAENADGHALRYLPSGREPVLHVGSRRGVPYRSKITYRLTGPPVPRLRFLDAVAVEELLLLDRALDFRGDVWPLLAKELAFAHYFELAHSHPQAVPGGWDALHRSLARLPWGSRELDEAVAAQVPDPQDRLDLEQFDRPLRGLAFDSPDALQQHVIAHVEGDLARRRDPRHSSDLAVFNALLAVLEPLVRILGSGHLSTPSLLRDVPWFFGFFSYFASGPPPRRLEELLALARAGLVRFLGPDVLIEARPQHRGTPATFIATSPAVPGEVRATTLVEARVPGATVSATADDLLLRQFDRGDVCEQVLVDDCGLTRIPLGRLLVVPDTCQVVTADGRPHERRYAFGSGTSAATPGAFSRPRTNAAFFRQNDRSARHVLAALAALAAGRRTTRRPAATGLASPDDTAPAHRVEVVYARSGDAPLARALDHLTDEVAARTSAPVDLPVDCAVLLRLNGDVVGLAGCTRPGDPGDLAPEAVRLTALWVDPAHRGRGLARLALDALLDRAADSGADAVITTVPDRFPEARELLRSSGFEPVAGQSLRRDLDPDGPRASTVPRPRLTPARAS